MTQHLEKREEQLGEIGERIIEIFRILQREVTVSRPGLIAITRAEADIMRFLMEEPGSTVTDIARAFGQHKSNTSTRIATLTERGLTRKELASEDGREVLVYPTELAVTNFESYRNVWAEVLDDIADKDPARIQTTVEVLRELSANLSWRRRQQ